MQRKMQNTITIRYALIEGSMELACFAAVSADLILAGDALDHWSSSGAGARVAHCRHKGREWHFMDHP